MTDAPLFADLPTPLADALGALRWPDDAYFDSVARIFSDVAFPLEFPGAAAETLTPVQRAVALALTERDLPSPLRSAFPAHRAVRRRWLGLDPKGPLEQSISFTLEGTPYEEPIWRMAKLVYGKWNQMPLDQYRALCQRFDGQFSLDERLRLWGEVNATEPRAWNLSHVAFFDYGVHAELVDQLRGEGASWAAAYLDAILADATVNLRTHDCTPAFMALVRAGVPLESRWDGLLPMDLRYARELLLALPESRRADAALLGLTRQHPGSALKVSIQVLPVLPVVAVVEFALTCIPKSMGSPRKHRRALREAAGTHAELLALLDAADAAAGPPLLLTPTRERSIAAEGPSAVFSELDHAQLLVAGKRYLGGKGAPIEVLLAHEPKEPEEERSLRGQLFYRAIADAKGKHVYDAWLYQTDSGIVFKAGTTRVAAEYVQRGVECKNERLAEALEEALCAECIEPSPVAEVSAPKKKRAKKSPEP